MENKNKFPSLILFTVFLLLAVAYTKGDMRCGSCGSTPVPYPLSIGPNCGDPSYKIICNSTESTLYLNSTAGVAYRVISVNPESQRIVIQPPTLIRDTCFSTDFKYEGLNMDESQLFNITSSNTIFLLNCTQDLSPKNCSSNSLCHTYINNTPSAAACRKEPLCCSFRTGGSQNSYTIRIRSDRCMGYQSYVNLDPSLPFSKWPAPGLELMWVPPPEPLCENTSDCRRDLPFSKCLPDPTNSGRKRCFCNKGRYWDPGTSYCEKCHPSVGCTYHGNPSSIFGLTIAGVVVLALTTLLVYKLRQYTAEAKQRIIVKEREEILNASTSGKSTKIFKGKEITKATNNFSRERLLGTGGFGEVFKGTLDDGTEIAVKRAKPGNATGTFQVLNEVRILCQVNHRRLVRLLGCCVELDQPLLIYEYVSNGTLYDHLHGYRVHQWAPLNWLRRLIIAHQTAEGLAYLHSSAIPPIYHRDVKSSNILLDENNDVKVSDFGLSRLVELSERDYTHIHTSAQGTLGYLDPEYYLNFQLTDKSDVYSFGVVLLELLTAKKAIDLNRDEENVNLVVYMKRIFDEEKLMVVIDPILRDGAKEIELETMKAIGNLACACLDKRRRNRPSMKEVADEIEFIINILNSDVAKT